MSPRTIFLLILGLDAILLLTRTTELSIAYNETQVLYGDFSFLKLLLDASINIFGQNDFALRIPMILLHLLSVVLLYEVSKSHVKDERNRLWLLLFYILTPGIISSAVLVNGAGVIIFGLLFFIYIYQNYPKLYSYLVLGILCVLNGAFIYLFFSLIFYAVYMKNKNMFILNIILFVSSFFLYGINTEGLPKGHFLDSIGVYAAIYTPIIFIYIVYTLYRRFLLKKLDILWFVSSVVLLLSLLLSFRQKLDLENFAPYLVLALPLAVQTYYSSYRVRLKEYRKFYKAMFIFALSFLIVNYLFVIYNKYLYLVVENPKDHFVYDFHVAKELAESLKNKQINCVTTDNKMQARLRFYGISKCEEHIISEKNDDLNNSIYVSISYKDKIVYKVYVTNINNK